MNPASINLTFAKPLSFLKQIANNSRDSRSHWVHIVGGERYRSQPRHQLTVVCLGIPSVISTLCSSKPIDQFELSLEDSGNCKTYEFLKQLTHKFAPFGSIGVPQSKAREVKN